MSEVLLAVRGALTQNTEHNCAKAVRINNRLARFIACSRKLTLRIGNLTYNKHFVLIMDLHVALRK